MVAVNQEAFCFGTHLQAEPQSSWRKLLAKVVGWAFGCAGGCPSGLFTHRSQEYLIRWLVVKMRIIEISAENLETAHDDL